MNDRQARELEAELTENAPYRMVTVTPDDEGARIVIDCGDGAASYDVRDGPSLLLSGLLGEGA